MCMMSLAFEGMWVNQGALGVKLTEEDGGVFHDAGFSNMGLLTSSLPGGSITSKPSVASEEIDPSVLSLLQVLLHFHCTNHASLDSV